ncbi:MAG: lipid-A-disaccharide synthase, partial [Leptospiraceae bacterium]|nr:lipid-A-disaccharide synthase [Leptospiraceae bacterium]
MNPVLVIAGEHSGDNLGGSLLAELSKYKEFYFFGIGGEKMKKAGLKSIVEIEELTVVGLVAAVFKYRKLKKLAHNVIQLVKERNCKHAILIDYPGFNLRLAEMLKKEIPNIKIVFYVSPQIWAWKYERIYKIKELVDLMLLLFPFEKEIYDKHEIPNEFVGHPIISEMPLRYAKGSEIQVTPNSKVIT